MSLALSASRTTRSRRMPDTVDDRSHWPTPEIPPAPVSAKTHGDPRTWTAEQWEAFSAWAHSLKDYGPGTRKQRQSNGQYKKHSRVKTNRARQGAKEKTRRRD